MCQENKLLPNQNGFSAILDQALISNHAPTLKDLSKDNELALLIIRFTFLWLIFEGNVLKDQRTSSTPDKIKRVSTLDKIKRVCKQWEDSKRIFNLIDDDIFICAKDYFCSRYVDVRKLDVLFTDETGHIATGDAYDKVKDMVCASPRLNPYDKALAVLIIINRYRNRLFHGPKWIKYDLKVQRKNFRHANCVLQCVIEL